MNDHDDKFQQRWDFRRREVDGDSSSDDSKSNASGGDPMVKRLKLCTDISLPENDGAITDTPICHNQDNKLVETKMKKKNNVVKRKPKKSPVKENKRKRKAEPIEMVISSDLKTFGDSLINELKVSRENMLAHMRDEMKKLVDLRFKSVKKKNARWSKTKNVKSHERPRGSSVSKFSKATNEPQEGDKSSRPSIAKTRVISDIDPNQVASSSYLSLPTVVSGPQFQNQRSGIPPLNDHMDIAKLMEANKVYHQFQPSQPGEHIGTSFSHRNMSQMPNIGFPVPPNQVLESNSNMSTLTHTENSFLSNARVGPRMNIAAVRFPNNMSSHLPYRSDEELFNEVARAQRWPNLSTHYRNEQ